MENPVIQSSQFASAMEDPDFHNSISPEYRPEFLEHEVDWIAKARRRGRKSEAEYFRAEYFYGRCKDEKTCVWPSGRESWSDESSGITWVGVHGKDTICVVTKAGDLDLSRVHGMLIFRTKEEVFRWFRRTVISEIEDLAAFADPVDLDDLDYLEDDCSRFRPCSSCRHLQTHVHHEVPLSKLREMFGESIETPFGVVSVVPLTDKVAQRTLPVVPVDDKKKTIKFLQEEMKRDTSFKFNETVQDSSDEYDEKTAIEFLEKEMRREQDFTLERTMQVAISAFQLLFKRNFNAKEIEVCVMDPNYFVYAEEAKYKDIYVKHLERGEIERVLADVNEPGSGGSSSGGSTITSDGSD